MKSGRKLTNKKVNLGKNDIGNDNHFSLLNIYFIY